MGENLSSLYSNRKFADNSKSKLLSEHSD
jgi:hypothetical protein